MTAIFCLVAVACRHDVHSGGNALFSEIASSQSHIDFANTIKEDKDYNILTYEYLYNGGGVAAADLNNDGLTDLVFSGNMVPLRLYANKGGMQFEDVSAKAGFSARDRWRTGVVIADVNGDGLPDIFVCYSGPGTDEARCNELYINDGGLHFTERAKEYGLDAPGTFTTTVAFFDMDRDGDLDMFMVNHGDMFFNPDFNTDRLRATRNLKFGNRLYRNDNGHFTDISDSAHIDGSGLNFGLSASISDVNGDGWPDIYVTNDYDERDFLYLNDHAGHFKEVLTQSAGHISEFAMGSDIADYNNDGKPDVVVLDMLPEDNHRQKLLRGGNNYDKYTLRARQGFHHQQMRNTLQLNNGNDSAGRPIFSEIGQLAGMSATDWSWAPLLADFDNDGWKDLFISDGILRDMTNLDFVKYTSGYSSNYRDGQTKEDKAEMWELVKEMPTTKLNNYIYRNEHDLRFSNKTSEWGLTRSSVSNGAVYADLDNDGDLDLVINNLNDAATVYMNNARDQSKGGRGHYLRLKLKGAGRNTDALGARVHVMAAGGEQWQEQYTSRGFQSSVDPVMHIGLGKDSVVDSLEVRWPDGKVSMMRGVRGDTILVIKEEGSVPGNEGVKAGGGLFTDVTAASGLDYVHQQSAVVDFKIQPLLPYQLSRVGPCLAKGDVNGDGLEDLFVGGSAGFESRLYIQVSEGKFAAAADQPWNADKGYTNTDAVMIDLDGDGDLDMYIVSGGNDHPIGDKHYIDRLFENDGHGRFHEVLLGNEGAMSGSVVRAADIDKDGRPDLFVGGRILPGKYPDAPESMVLMNKGHMKFERVAVQSGMVTDAVWMDVNKDGWPDLVVAGEFMPVMIYENERGKLTDKTAEYGLANTRGWWNRLLATDVNGDGEMDLVVGNLGLNTFFKAGPSTPMRIYCSDFNGDGLMDPVLCLYNGGVEYPYFSRDEILEQIPSLQKKIARYAAYADATMEDLFSAEQLSGAKKVQIDMLSSAVLVRGKGRRFDIKALPSYAQMSAVNGIISEDMDGDGHDDLVLAGNFYPLRAQMGPLDAGIGLVLRGDGKGNFTPLPYAQTGLCLRGDVRGLIEVKGRQGAVIVAAKNNGPLQVVRKQQKGGKR